jgi:hypothetical protein
MVDVSTHGSKKASWITVNNFQKKLVLFFFFIVYSKKGTLSRFSHV